ncbi:hypothetical protein [Kitasatospora sp. CB01950]|nr:hypothetical protein [Kitasatospora sp. CB01950]
MLRRYVGEGGVSSGVGRAGNADRLLHPLDTVFIDPEREAPSA